MKKLIAITIALPVLTTLACSKSEAPPPAPAATVAPATTLPAPVSVSAVSLGTAIGADKRVTAAADERGVSVGGVLTTQFLRFRRSFGATETQRVLCLTCGKHRFRDAPNFYLTNTDHD